MKKKEKGEKGEGGWLDIGETDTEWGIKASRQKQ